ncbi:carboxypeptidase-like regulatory domain-containing protein [Pontibacter sp. SGAir0037]|uniref:carboxypeptidase-like regulatory domain-containing protein n=1 Tax=Pontibacter sp. SGAir0037 TaxID=2571030 RepID=UPI0010F5E134|nr:carboxypeptidase-like regulatory domain-containing protein [Pontibacter sp. SGAir0037]
MLNHSQVAAQHVQVISQVIDGKTHAPVAYASIGLINSNRGTVTDAEGRFYIMLPSSGT